MGFFVVVGFLVFLLFWGRGLGVLIIFAYKK